MAVFSKIAFALIFCTIFYTYPAVATSDDPYIKLLNDEAEGVSLDSKGQKKDVARSSIGVNPDGTKKQWAWEGELIGDLLPKGLAQDEFVTLLEQNFYGSFVFFRRLDAVDQGLVYKKYKGYTKPDINLVRSFILKLYR